MDVGIWRVRHSVFGTDLGVEVGTVRIGTLRLNSQTKDWAGLGQRRDHWGYVAGWILA